MSTGPRDRVVVRLTVFATENRDPDTPLSARHVEGAQIHIWRVADRQLAEHWMVRAPGKALLSSPRVREPAPTHPAG